MNITRKAITELKAAEYNPRVKLREGDREYEKIKNSIERFGYIEPVIWNRQTGNVVGGHQRLQVLTDLGETEVDVVEVDLPLLKEKQLNVTLNKVRGRWDYEKLEGLLNDLEDVAITGFEQYEIDELNMDYSHIDELLEEEFTTFSAAERDTFNMTFVLPIEAREAVEGFLKVEAARDILADVIVQKAQGLI